MYYKYRKKGSKVYKDSSKEKKFTDKEKCISLLGGDSVDGNI